MTKKREFYIGEYYHIFNRGVDKREIFLDKGDIYYFFDSMQISNKITPIQNSTAKNIRKKEKERAKKEEKLVEIIAYALLPNHFHFILKERVEGGISKFISKLNGSYSHYFNAKNERAGTLFQGRFKANKITGELSRELTSAYVNLNYKHHNYDIKRDLVKTSVFEYLGEEKGEKVCNQKEIKNIIDTIGSIKDYKEYIKEQSKYFVERHDKNPYLINFDELEK